MPGTYEVALEPSLPATQVSGASRTAKLAAPATGIVRTSVLSAAKNGLAARSVRNAGTLWATFRFALVPKGALKVTWYLTPAGKKQKRQNLGAATKSPTSTVTSFIRLAGRKGKITAVLTRKGVIVAQRSITAR